MNPNVLKGNNLNYVNIKRMTSKTSYLSGANHLSTCGVDKYNIHIDAMLIEKFHFVGNLSIDILMIPIPKQITYNKSYKLEKRLYDVYLKTNDEEDLVLASTTIDEFLSEFIEKYIISDKFKDLVREFFCRVLAD